MSDDTRFRFLMGYDIKLHMGWASIIDKEKGQELVVNLNAEQLVAVQEAVGRLLEMLSGPPPSRMVN